jgi:HPt (histidine-containing phosphotransfer) domain-containing protein
MLEAPIPEDDVERVAALHAMKILDTIPEERFDRITRIVKTVFNVPIALVSLVDANRQWFKSCIGLDVSETPRNISFCGHAIMKDDVFYIPDATKDPRFSDNPIVTGPPFVIFYAGQPLRAKNGKKIGTLCIIDNHPRELSESDLQTIRDMGMFAENELNVLSLSQALIIQKESEERIREVMDNVEEGIFLLSKTHQLGTKYSLALEKILSKEKLANLSIYSILQNSIPEKSMSSLKDYLDLMFVQDMDEEMLSQLNPLGEVEVVQDGSTKYLNFKFTRVYKEKEIEHLVATVRDITKQVILSKEIKEAEKNAQASLEKLFGILHVEPVLLKQFIESAKEELDQVNHYLQDTATNIPEKIELMFRAIHSVKGDAALLEIKIFADKAHSFEDAIGQLRGKAGVTGTDFIPFTLMLTDLQSIISEVETIIGKLMKFQESFGTDKPDAVKLFLKAIQNQIDKESKLVGKQIIFDHKALDLNSLPIQFQKLIKDILIQLVRNSIAHGIELAEDRKVMGKASAGTIKISSFFSNGFFELEYSDDGYGLNLEKLKEKAVNLKLASESEIQNWNEEKLSELIYISGISTAEETTMVAGRGVGMDIIKDRIQKIKGSIQVSFKAKQYCKFNVRIPI